MMSSTINKLIVRESLGQDTVAKVTHTDFLLPSHGGDRADDVIDLGGGGPVGSGVGIVFV